MSEIGPVSLFGVTVPNWIHSLIPILLSVLVIGVVAYLLTNLVIDPIIGAIDRSERRTKATETIAVTLSGIEDELYAMRRLQEHKMRKTIVEIDPGGWTEDSPDTNDLPKQ